MLTRACKGHEFSGTIAELGDGVTDLKVGQKVAVFPVLTDGTCYWCQENLYGMCVKWGFLGYSGYGGGMAEYVCVERKAIHLVPNNMSLEVAALVEPLAVGWHGVNVGKVGPEDTCLVVGAGELLLLSVGVRGQVSLTTKKGLSALPSYIACWRVASRPSSSLNHPQLERRTQRTLEHDTF